MHLYFVWSFEGKIICYQYLYLNLKSKPIPNYTRCIKEKICTVHKEQNGFSKMGFGEDVLSDDHNYNNSWRNMRGKTPKKDHDKDSFEELINGLGVEWKTA